MKLIYKLVMFLILILSSCKNESKITLAKSKASIQLQKKNEVVFVTKGSVSPFTGNVSCNIFNTNYELMYFNIKERMPLVIPTDSVLNLAIFNNYRYRLKLKFKKGDTIFFTQKNIFIDGKEKVNFPYFEVFSRKVNPYELNFDYYISKNTPTINTYPHYKGHNDFLNRNKKTIKVSLKHSYTDVYNNTIKVLDSFFIQKKITLSFYNLKLKELKIDKALYEIYEATKMKEKVNFGDFGVSLSDTLMYDNEIYLAFLNSYIINTYFLTSNKKPTLSSKFDTVLNKEKKIIPKLKNALLYKYLQGIYHVENENFFKRYNLFKLLFPKKHYVNSFEYQLSETKKDDIYNKEFSASTGKLKTLNSSRTLDLKEIIKKEKGKIILVDFWASWCAPCRVEIPKLKEIQKDIGYKNMAVISISTDKSYNSWIKASRIESLDDEKHNYILINPKKSSIIKHFKINTIPRYLLYDQNGQLVNDNAPRPSDERLKKIIFSYINE